MSNPYGDLQTHLGVSVAELVTPLPVVITPAAPDPLTPATLHRAVVANDSQDTELAAAEPGKIHKVLGWLLAFSNTGGEEDHTMELLSNGTALTGQMPVNVGGTASVPLVVPPTLPVPIVQTAAGEALVMRMTNASAHGVLIYITENA